MLLIDISTGTVLTAEHCRLLPDDALTEAEWDALNDMSDSEAAELARERGRPVVPDHLNAVADIVRATGRTINDI